MTQQIDPAQAIDLSELGKPNPATPPGTFTCKVGCGLTVRGVKPHETVADCLQTTLPYVEMFLEMEHVTKTQMVPAMNQLERQRGALLDANERLRAENDDLKRDLRDARRGTPAAKAAVLEGAEDLAASMKAAVQPQESTVLSHASDVRDYLVNRVGVPQNVVDETADDDLGALYETYTGK